MLAIVPLICRAASCLLLVPCVAGVESGHAYHHKSSIPHDAETHSVESQGSADAVNGVARSGEFESSGIELLSWMDLPTFPDDQPVGSDIWGYVSPSGREYALMGLWQGVGFVEVTDPRHPTLVGYIPGPASTWRDMKVYGEYAYVVIDNSGLGMQVVDLRDIDNGSVALARTVTQRNFFTAHNIALNDDSGYAYLVGANIDGGGLTPVDLSDPSHPMILSGWSDTYIHDVQVVTYHDGPYAGREIAFACAGGAGVIILDVTSKFNMFLVSALTYPTMQYTHQGWLSEDRRYLFVDDELDERGGTVDTTTTYVFNVEDLEAPTLVATFTNGRTSIDHNLMVRGPFVFEANYTSGLRVYNACDVQHVGEVGYFDTYPESDASVFNGAWGVFTDLPSGVVLLSDRNRGLFVFDTQGIEVIEPRRMYVAQDAAGAADGSSWADAYPELADALDAVAEGPNCGTEVWVATGWYTPDRGSGDRQATFLLRSGVSVLGGFAGDERSASQRDPFAYNTALAGTPPPEGSGDDPVGSYHVVSAIGTDHTALLDGFFVTLGNADGDYPDDRGGGLYAVDSNVTVRHCRFESGYAESQGGAVWVSGGAPSFEQCQLMGNRCGGQGGAVLLDDAQGSFDRCLFFGNRAESFGGAMFLTNHADVDVRGCQFSLNQADQGGAVSSFVGGTVNLSGTNFLANDARVGGAIQALQTDCHYDNDLFVRNTVAEGGGALFHNLSTVTMTHCTVADNKAKINGGGMLNVGSDATVSNSILWMNQDASGQTENAQLLTDGGSVTTLTFSCVQGKLAKLDPNGNSGADPRLMGDRNYRLGGESPYRDAGDPQFSASCDLKDLDGHRRTMCGRTDLGAYEAGAGDYDCNGQVSLGDYSAWGACQAHPDDPGCAALDLNADCAVGLADFGLFQVLFDPAQ